MIDQYERDINYLRVSVTDRCNLRCTYCMPKEGLSQIGHDDILRYEEILAIVRVGASMGLRKVRLTGGEPLVRTGIADLVAMINGVPGIQESAANLVCAGEDVVSVWVYFDNVISSANHINLATNSHNRRRFHHWPSQWFPSRCKAHLSSFAVSLASHPVSVLSSLRIENRTLR